LDVLVYYDYGFSGVDFPETRGHAKKSQEGIIPRRCSSFAAFFIANGEF